MLCIACASLEEERPTLAATTHADRPNQISPTCLSPPHYTTNLEAICCPPCFVQEPGDLCCLAAPCLAHNNNSRVVFNKVQQFAADLLGWELLLVFCARPLSWWLLLLCLLLLLLCAPFITEVDAKGRLLHAARPLEHLVASPRGVAAVEDRLAPRSLQWVLTLELLCCLIG